MKQTFCRFFYGNILFAFETVFKRIFWCGHQARSNQNTIQSRVDLQSKSRAKFIVRKKICEKKTKQFSETNRSITFADKLVVNNRLHLYRMFQKNNLEPTKKKNPHQFEIFMRLHVCFISTVNNYTLRIYFFWVLIDLLKICGSTMNSFCIEYFNFLS